MNLQGDSIRNLTPKKTPLAAEKNMYTADVGGNILWVSSKSCDLWHRVILKVLRKPFCLDGSLIGERWILITYGDCIWIYFRHLCVMAFDL